MIFITKKKGKSNRIYSPTRIAFEIRRVRGEAKRTYRSSRGERNRNRAAQTRAQSIRERVQERCRAANRPSHGEPNHQRQFY